jgi:hypothetical protein
MRETRKGNDRRSRMEGNTKKNTGEKVMERRLK